ncbi:hypothetical protein LWI28_015998 [Acer negundo]|uniref:Uncharacterized protein n=1 Tax=Acer negundo TaxID=4023 RepID=A0AAD5NQ74_ACENE|nr:hypothetical protein LWI28_015998 [Acer negundo]
MRRKEPKLYRNGCTQRIRACGRNLIDGNFSLPGQIDDVKNGTSIGEGEEDEEVNDSVQEDSKFSENKAEKDPKMVLQSGCEEVTGSDLEFVKACTVQTTTNNDEELLDTLELTRQENAKSSTFIGVLPTQSLNDKFIKYTFQRKRKKERMSSTDGDSLVDESIVKRKMEGKQNDFLKSQNSSLVTESSRDSRRLVQVARQLISLSEKKQWK